MNPTPLENAQQNAVVASSSRTPHPAQPSRDAALLWNHRHGRWFDLVWLVYSVFFFIEPLQRNTLRGWVQFALLYALFLLCYLGIIRARSHRVAHLCMAGMAVLGFFWYATNPGAAGAIIYVAAFAPFVFESIPFCLGIFAAIVLGVITEGILLHASPWSWGMVSIMSVAVGAGNLFGAQRMRAAHKLNRAEEEIAHLAKVAERERIARDLHDVLGHTLSVVVLKSELAGKMVDRDPARARKEISEVENIARTALGEVREAIRGYRAEGLPMEVDRARATLDAAGVTLECVSAPPKLLPAEETILSLVLREAVTNIVRHAHASMCRISFANTSAEHCITIEDDGRGGIRHEGSGLRGMRERIESLGGRLRVESAGATRLIIEIPVPQEPA